MISYSTHNTRGVAHLVVPFSEIILEKLPHDIDAYMVADAETEIEEEMEIEAGAEYTRREIEDIAEGPTNHRKLSASTKKLFGLNFTPWHAIFT